MSTVVAGLLHAAVVALQHPLVRMAVLIAFSKCSNAWSVLSAFSATTPRLLSVTALDTRWWCRELMAVFVSVCEFLCLSRYSSSLLVFVCGLEGTFVTTQFWFRITGTTLFIDIFLLSYIPYVCSENHSCLLRVTDRMKNLIPIFYFQKDYLCVLLQSCVCETTQKRTILMDTYRPVQKCK